MDSGAKRAIEVLWQDLKMEIRTKVEDFNEGQSDNRIEPLDRSDILTIARWAYGPGRGTPVQKHMVVLTCQLNWDPPGVEVTRPEAYPPPRLSYAIKTDGPAAWLFDQGSQKIFVEHAADDIIDPFLDTHDSSLNRTWRAKF